MKRVAVIGSGIAGLSAAWSLSEPRSGCAVSLFEAGSRFGGHAHTVEVTLKDEAGAPVTHGVDIGFLVYNQRTYPRFIQLLDSLGVDTAPSEMSFSVQTAWPPGMGQRRLEWSGSNLNTVFAQRRNLLSPRFLGLLVDVLRFNRLATRLATRLTNHPDSHATGSDTNDAQMTRPIGEFLDLHGFGQGFRDGYFLPMIACIWSCPIDQMLRFPTASLIRFCHNHGLIQVRDRPPWRTVAGGSRRYVDAMLARIGDQRLNSAVQTVRRTQAGALVQTAHGTEHFDAVVMAAHSDQSLALLGDDASAQERAVLSAIRYQDNLAVLHTDCAVLPQRRSAWAAWNYERAPSNASDRDRVCLHYWINRLQPLPWRQPVIVSLNPVRPPNPEQVLLRQVFAHPAFDQAALSAQAELPALQGRRSTWFAGAWCGHGFHEDGLRSGMAAAAGVRNALHRGQQAGADGSTALPRSLFPTGDSPPGPALVRACVA